MIFFDFHPAAPAITALAPLQFVINEIEIDGKMGGNTLDECNKCGPVRLSSRPKAQHALSIAEFSATMTDDASLAESCRQGSTGDVLPGGEGFRFHVPPPLLRARYPRPDGSDRRRIPDCRLA